MNAFINEFHYDNNGTDTGEFIEVAGPAGTDLTGWTLQLYNGNGGARYETIPLSGQIADAGSGFGFVSLPANRLQNGAPDGIALVDDAGAVVEFISYEGSFTAVDGDAAGLTSTDIGLSEAGSTPTGFSLHRVGTGSTVSDFSFAEPEAETPGAINAGQVFESPGDFDLRITEIWPGNEPGSNLTADWFEITNAGATAWSAADAPLFYDDDSQDATAADPIDGLTQLRPGASAIVVVGASADVDAFTALWSQLIDLGGVEVGSTDGSGLGQGGDGVTLFVDAGEDGPGAADIADFESYPDANADGGRSWDVDRQAFSVNSVAGAVTTATVNDEGQPAVGSPGNGAPAGGGMVSAFTLELLHFSDNESPANAAQEAPRMSAVLNALRAQDIGEDAQPDNTLTIASGDLFLGGVFYNASAPVFGSAGIADTQLLNELGIQASALGNHDFDFGTGVLAGLVSGSAPGDFSALTGSTLEGLDFTGTDFPYLSANLDFSTDANLALLEVPGGQAPEGMVVTSSVVIALSADGEPTEEHGEVVEKIGIVGATTPTLDRISSPGDVGISPLWAGTQPTPAELDALAAEIQAEVDALLAANPGLNKVILAAHMQQLDIELALAERLENVDIIIAGGSNTRLFDDNDRPRADDSDQGQYPQFVTNAGGTTTAVVNTDGSYKYVGRLVIDFDEDGNIIPSSYDPDVSGAYATDAQGVADLNAGGLIDPEVQAIADAIQDQIIETESNLFGISDVFLNANRAGADTPDDPDGVRTQETNLGDLTADANLAIAQAADADVVVSIKNGGGIRASIGQVIVPAGGTDFERFPNEEITVDGEVIKPAGGISQTDIQTTLAFNNGLTLLTLTRAELVAVLEHGVSALPGVAGQFPQVAGVNFAFDPDLPAGDRIVSAAIVDDDGNVVAELVRDGEIAGDPGQTFRVVTLNFLAEGGDGYPFPTGPEANRVDLFADANDDGFADTVEEGAPASGRALFAGDGTEQDALAEYLTDTFATVETAYDQADGGRAEDERIQNLTYREDAVFGDSPEEPEAALSIALAGSLALDGAEIVALDPETARAYVTSSAGLHVVDASDIMNPTLVTTLDADGLGFDASAITSVTVANAIVAVARPDATKTDNGQVLFYDADTLQFLGVVRVGPLPDMLTFNEDGTVLLVVNEGESASGDNLPDVLPNPNGSVSVIHLNPNNPTLSAVTTLDFSDTSITAEALEAKGVRINPNAPSAAADIEPEYITIQGNQAFITLQENNAVAVIEDITNPQPFTIDSIQSLGLQDHGRGQPSLQTYDFEELPLLGVDANGQELDLGGFSGLQFKAETETTITFLTVPDRGPNGGDVVDGARTFNLPDYQARVVELILDKTTGQVSIGETIPLTRLDGTTPITGLPNIKGVDEIPVDAAGNPLGYDPLGADLEGLVLDDDGTFWMVDEYRPAIYHFGAEGQLLNRLVPEGTAAQVGLFPGSFGMETLPAEFAERRDNRGFEAVAADLAEDKLYGFIQTPLQNPDPATSSASQVIRILQIDVTIGEPTAEFAYLLEDPGNRPGGVVDKIGDAVFDPSTGNIFVVERDSEFGTTAIKPIYEIDLSGATNVLGMTFPNGKTLEQQTPESLAALGINPVFKTEVVNPPSLGYTPSDKIEGLALLPDSSLAVLNDNDFGIEAATGLLPQLGIISFEGNELDASNEDGGINFANYDTLGLKQADSIASYEVDGVIYYATANEGDTREVDETRGAGLVDGDPSNGEVDAGLDPELLAQLADPAQLGRLLFSNVDGDIDADGDIDVLHSFGGRSFSIYDEFGNLVFDSGDDFEKITAELVPTIFNSDQSLPEESDERSDDKGPEPEALTLGEINGRTYAFIGLERTGGIMVYDVTDPVNAAFDQYLPPNGNIAPEGLTFISAEHSPSGKPLLAVASEVSETLAFYEITPQNPGDPAVAIHEIQGPTPAGTTDDASPLAGETVTIEAIVVGDFQSDGLGSDGDLGGFFVQEEDADADGDASTSEGIFIFEGFDPTKDIQVGDKVRITGAVGEFFGETQLSSLTNVEVISSGSDLPTAAEITFPVAGTKVNADGVLIADLEAYEGMLVEVTQEMTVADLFTFGRFGDIGLYADGRLPTFTQVNAPAAAAYEAYQELAVRNTLILDDGRSIQNPAEIPLVVDGVDGDVPGYFDANDEFRTGDTIPTITGVLEFGAAAGGSGDEIYRLHPTETPVFENANPRPQQAPDVGGGTTVASFNVLNFFTTLGDEGLTSGPDGLEPRGAADELEFDRQLDKLIAALSEMQADVFGLIELENEFGDQNGDGQFAVETIVAELNQALPGANYQFADPGTPYIGSDAITVALIYDANSVALADGTTVEFLEDADLAGLGLSFGNPVFDGEGTSRNPLAATFGDLATGGEFTVAINHFKSKGSASAFGDNADAGDGAGASNEARLQAAIALDAWLGSNPTGADDDDVLVIGDLNAYAMEDPIQYLLGQGFTNLAAEFGATDAFNYSFGFPVDLATSPQAQAFGTLDYGLASSSLLGQVTGAAEWHVNADEASVLDYNTEFKPQAQIDGLYADNAFRSSDHDPVVIGLNLEPEAGEFVELLGSGGNDRLVGTDANEILNGLGGNDRYTGRGGRDIFVLGDGDLDGARDFMPGEDLIDVSAWGTQGIEELKIVGGGGRLEIRDEANQNVAVVRIPADKLPSGELTAENFIFAPVEDLVLTGTDENDRLAGRAGNDLFDGLLGRDVYRGNAGADTFGLGADATDTVRDFEDGIDLLDVSQWGVTAFDQLRVAGLGGGGARVSGRENSAVIRSEDPAFADGDLSADDFLFETSIA